MMQFDHFFQRPEFKPWHSVFQAALAERTRPGRHGDLPAWLDTLNQLPPLKSDAVDLNSDTITLACNSPLAPSESTALRQALYALSPWRKGPYQVFDTLIDTEWRSDWKWQRVIPNLSPLEGKRVLDVGCGNGYHCWRMLGEGAQYVLGIDPSMRFLVQYMAIKKYAQHTEFDLLPLGIEDMPPDMPVFDSVFSMGVLYHRRNPINHLLELHGLLQDGGELVLETLIVDEAETGVLRPEKRYAQMRNVWSILTVERLLALLEQAGFTHARCVDQNVTSLKEQRRTDWMQFHSLQEFLDPNDLSKTIEGYPAPKRGIFIAKKK